MGNGRLARGTRQRPLPPVQADPDHRGSFGIAWCSGQLCVAPPVLDRRFCRSGPHRCRSNRILRSGSAAVAHAVKPALNRPLPRKSFEIENIRPALLRSFLLLKTSAGKSPCSDLPVYAIPDKMPAALSAAGAKCVMDKESGDESRLARRRERRPPPPHGHAAGGGTQCERGVFRAKRKQERVSAGPIERH